MDSPRKLAYFDRISRRMGNLIVLPPHVQLYPDIDSEAFQEVGVPSDSFCELQPTDVPKAGV